MTELEDMFGELAEIEIVLQPIENLNKSAPSKPKYEQPQKALVGYNTDWLRDSFECRAYD